MAGAPAGARGLGLPAVRRPWLPAGLAAHGFTTDTVGRLSYIVLEEAVEATVTFGVSPWPVADADGRLRFLALDARREIGLDLAQLRDELYQGWLGRGVRVGDVFAACLHDDVHRRLAGGDIARWDAPLADLLAGPVYDLTAEARVVAKLAYYAATGAVLPGGVAARWDLLALAERGDGAAPDRRLPRDGLGGAGDA